jgi:hypothetical protein
MITANYHTITGETVGETLTFGTNDLEFATLQAVAVTGMQVIIESASFSLLGDGLKRMVISK